MIVQPATDRIYMRQRTIVSRLGAITVELRAPAGYLSRMPIVGLTQSVESDSFVIYGAQRCGSVDQFQSHGASPGGIRCIIIWKLAARRESFERLHEIETGADDGSVGTHGIE